MVVAIRKYSNSSVHVIFISNNIFEDKIMSNAFMYKQSNNEPVESCICTNVCSTVHVYNVMSEWQQAKAYISREIKNTTLN